MTRTRRLPTLTPTAPRGEFVLILEGALDEPETEQDEAERLASAAEAVRRRVEQGQTQKDAVKAVSAETGVKKKRAVPLCSITHQRKPLPKQRFFCFLHLFLMCFAAAAGALSASGTLRMPFAQRNIAARSPAVLPFTKAIRQLAAGVAVDQLHRCGPLPICAAACSAADFPDPSDGWLPYSSSVICTHSVVLSLRGKLAERRQTANSAALSVSA